MSDPGSPRQSYPDILVARIKGAAQAGLPHKLIAHLTGVSKSMVSRYVQEGSRKEVAPDCSVRDRLRDWLHGEI